jgi:hypothetical protein
MDTRGVRVDIDDAGHRKVAGVVLAAMDDLDYRSSDLLITVQPDPNGRPGVEAFSFTLGILVTPELLNGDPRRLAWVLSEEVGHRYLNEMFGIPHGGDFIDRFAQEGFGSWLQCYRLFQSGLYTPEDVNTQPITEYTPSPGLGRDLGKHAGSALAGSYKSGARLAEWYASAEGGLAFKQHVRATIEGFQAPESPADLARAIASSHAAARRC